MVRPTSRGLVERLGKYKHLAMPGFNWIIPVIDRMFLVNITEVTGMEGEVITMTDVFVFEQTGFENNRVVGRLRPTGLRPKFMDKIEESGIHLPASIFGVGDRRRY